MDEIGGAGSKRGQGGAVQLDSGKAGGECKGEGWQHLVDRRGVGM
jgi:hypothetical protein